MVGASMASMLADLPLRIGLIDRQALGGDAANKPGVASFDARVSALSPASQKLFENMGIWQQIRRVRSCPYRDMEVWDGEGTGRIEFSARELNCPELGNIVENSVVTTALHSAIGDQQNLQVLAPVQISDLAFDCASNRKVQLTLSSGETLSGKLLIAADGANSRIRKLADFSTREWDYNHVATVCTVRTELPHGHRALQRFMASGPLAFLPLLPEAGSRDQHYCSIVWSALPERAEALIALAEPDFRRELGAAIEDRLGAIEWSDTRHSFPLRQRHAVAYVKGSVALIGDAAHSIHPLAGQGVNLGLLDAAALAEELKRGLKAHRPVGDSRVLNRYQRRRIGPNLAAMWLMEGFKRLFADQPLPLLWLRNVGMSSMDSMPLVKRQLALRAMGLDGDLSADSSIVSN